VSARSPSESLFFLLLICLLWLSPLEAAICGDPAGLDAWLAGFKREAAANGISGAALSALDGLTYDASIVAKYHGQHVFHQSFEQFAGPTLRALATLAYDCRRSAMFQAELMDALRLIQRGDLSPNARGVWAGEVGQTPCLPPTSTSPLISLAMAAVISSIACPMFSPRQPFSSLLWLAARRRMVARISQFCRHQGME
jgi:membrane-bound lytic murein transglycosylase B